MQTDNLIRILELKTDDLINEVIIFGKSLGRQVDVFDTNAFRSVYIHPNRPDAVLLSCHADTVWQDADIKVKRSGNLLLSDKVDRGLTKKGFPYSGGLGIGADDRAGCAMALDILENTGHAMLLTGMEEKGCLSACELVSDENIAEKLNDHQFMVALDRRGPSDLVFYGTSNDKFEKYCQKETGYHTNFGNGSDIGILCESICGVNISVGYRNEHTENECINLRWWLNTYNVVNSWLSKQGLPKHEL